jgi:hypothetical protein
MVTACPELSQEEPKSTFHNSNIVLYFDEPNMGVHLNPKVRGVRSHLVLMVNREGCSCLKKIFALLLFFCYTAL